MATTFISFKKNKHTSPKLQRTWNKYGEEVFTFEIIEECDIEDLLFKEKEYILQKDSCKKGYNCVIDSENKNRSLKNIIKYYIDNKPEIDIIRNNIFKPTEDSHTQKKMFIEVEKYKTSKTIIKRLKDVKSNLDYCDFILALYYNKKHKYLLCFLNGLEIYNHQNKEEVFNFLNKNKLDEEYL